MKIKNHGFTLIELMIVIAIIGVVLVIGGLFVTRCFFSGGQAEKEAHKWAASMGYDIQGVSCVDRDTDGDGYVSCTVNVKSNPQPIPIECAVSISMNSGCRVQKPVIR